MKNKRVYLLMVILLLGIAACMKISNKISSSERGEGEDISIKELNITKIKLSNIPQKNITGIYRDDQPVQETQDISFNMQRLIDIAGKDDEGIVVTNYTPANAYDIYVDLNINNEETVTLFSLDTVKAFTITYIKYSDIFKDSIFYNSKKEKVNIGGVIKNIKYFTHQGSFKLNWDKGNNRYLDKLATIKTKWEVRIRDYYGNKLNSGESVCPSDNEPITPFVSRVYICAIINIAYLYSQDDFRELYLSLYLYDDDVKVLTVDEKASRLDRLLNMSNFNFGITSGSGWAGGGGYLTNIYTVGIKNCFASSILNDVRRGELYDPFIYKDKVTLKDSATGFYRYMNSYGTFHSKQIIAHEFGHHMGFSHVSNYTYPDGGDQSIYKDVETIKGTVQNIRFLASFQGGVEIIHYKYMRDNSYPVRREDYFRPNDFEMQEPYKTCPTTRMLRSSNHTCNGCCEVRNSDDKI